MPFLLPEQQQACMSNAFRSREQDRMYKHWFIPVVALSAAFGGQAQASGRDPLVIPAFDQTSQPRTAQRAPAQHHRTQAAQPAAPRYAAAQQRPAYTQPSRGQYGGGFIEMLMTGRDPTTARGATYHAPPPIHRCGATTLRLRTRRRHARP